MKKYTDVDIVAELQKLVDSHCNAPQQTPFDATQHGSELFRIG